MLRRAFRPVVRSRPLRYYSEASKIASEPLTDNTAAKAPSENSETPITKGAPVDDVPQADSPGLEKQLAEMKDKYIRQVAEFRNLQTRTTRDVTAAKDFAIQKFAKDLIESVDNLDRALQTVPETAKVKENTDLMNLYNGLKMTEQILMKTLSRHGLQKFTGMGEKFNPNLHEVLYEVPSAEGQEAGTITQVQTTGFTLNGRTIRAAKVGVVKS